MRCWLARCWSSIARCERWSRPRRRGIPCGSNCIHISSRNRWPVPNALALMSFFLHLQGWLTLVALPVLLLIFIQVSFLPLPRYRDHLGAEDRSADRLRPGGRDRLLSHALGYFILRRHGPHADAPARDFARHGTFSGRRIALLVPVSDDSRRSPRPPLAQGSIDHSAGPWPRFSRCCATRTRIRRSASGAISS